MSNKVVLITGTNSGFGWLTANTLAELGHKVYATMRDTQSKNADKAKALAQVANITVLDVTLTDDASVKTAIDSVIAAEGRIDVLVNNAGFAASGVTESFTTTDVEEMFGLHVVAYWRLMKAVLPVMRQQADGLIVNISSGAGRFAFPFMTVYSAAKFGLEGLSEGLHYEVKPLGVDVAIIQPGAFPTDILHKVRTGSDESVVAGYGALAEIPNQMGNGLAQLFETTKPNPQEVADAVVTLINLPKGERPLRTVVDPSTGYIVEAANEAVQVEYEKTITAFGMGSLLN
ncbi:SDR family oxidoreductase [Runella sp. SP2]|uniref:SDR family oxidoreductase n=1 Tax=Runella sp. SP2 TaxID=2268026 RepID=UPI000F076C87|nr:SDR family oxidoreductase [Runella sp. SP2]AYQ36541.1 SDR family NAD(P)-dependent oxidoreductase [Runella sp. SP2]